jgi:hypothetical protein
MPKAPTKTARFAPDQRSIGHGLDRRLASKDFIGASGCGIEALDASGRRGESLVKALVIKMLSRYSSPRSRITRLLKRSRNKRKLRRLAFRNPGLRKLRRPLNTFGLPEEVLSKKRRKFRPQHINFRRKGYLVRSNSFRFWADVVTAHAFASAEPRRADSAPHMDVLEYTDDAGGRIDRIVEV